MLLVTCCRKVQVEPVTNNAANHPANNVAMIKAKNFRKLTRNLAIMAILYFFVRPLPNGLFTVFATEMPAMLLSVGLYCSWLTFVEGSVSHFPFFCR